MPQRPARAPRQPSLVSLPAGAFYVQRFRDHLVAQAVSPHTRNAYLSDLSQAQQFSPIAVEDWSAAQIQDWLLHRQQLAHSPRSISRMLSALRRAWLAD